jgi:nucleoside-triphosphatase THEP1
MVVTEQLNQKWLKASVLGCLWASSEIVLGSFLHNLRVPFTGTILTGIGVMLLVSVSFLWKEKGLFWRSGIVCALMKTVSPSALIFGPMIAILSEAILLEISVRLIGKNWAGFIIGGVLAMTWSLFQRIANLIIYYGFNMVELYTNLTKYAQKQLQIQSDNVWMPVLVLWIFYFAAGVAAAIAGILIGKRAVTHPYRPENLETHKITRMQSGKKETVFSWSLPWLAFNIFGIITALFLMNSKDWKIWIICCVILLSVWSFRYHKALHPLKKPRFWIFFVLITMLTSFLFVKIQNMSNGWYEGLMTGLQMNFRAALMIVGFSTIGTELYNPVIRNFFIKTSFRQLPLALEVAFDTLPHAIAKLPAVKDIFKSPVSIVHQLVSHADYFLENVNLRFSEKPFVVILTGKIGEGKSGLLNEILGWLRNNQISAGGILSPAVMENGKHVGYDLINADTGERSILSRISENDDLIKVGRFSFYQSGIAFGNKALSPDNNAGTRIIVVDEIGPWELEDQGWAPAVSDLLTLHQTPMIWVVRESIVAKVIENWNLNKYKIFNVAECGLAEITGYIEKNMLRN